MLAAVAAMAAGCTDGDEPTAGDPAAEEATPMGDLQLTSPAFDDGEPIPEKYGRAYENVNPPLEIASVPSEAESLALVMDDPDAPSGTFDHWLVWNIPPDIDRIPEGWDPPSEVVEGENGFGNAGYGGPRPPEEHTYRFELDALDAALELDASAGKEQLGDATDGHVLARTQLTGTFAP